MLRNKPQFLFTVLIIFFVMAFFLSIGIGAISIGPIEGLQILLDSIGLHRSSVVDPTKAVVLTSIRLPRVLAAGLVGMALAVSGACVQGLFRNPLADPGLIGISAGASLSAALFIVLGSGMAIFGYPALSVLTFAGGAITAFFIYRMSQSGGTVIVATMLLAGIAINALAGAFTGLLTYLSDDNQLRDITFWMLGSVGGANWSNVLVLLPFVIFPTFMMITLSKKLNAFSLGERDAVYLGVNVHRLKIEIILFATIAVGASVSIAGIIGFIGLVIPHLIRLIAGPDHKVLLIASVLLGSSVLMLADLLCRTLIAPSEIPVGIVTAIIGAPVFLSILMREKRKRVFATI
jgi:iron complex transport system permease protein